MNFKYLVGAGIGALLFSGGALAHHTHAHYESEANTVLEGTIKEFEWVNPHSWITITVVNEVTGAAEDWLLEARAPVALTRSGWTQDSLKPGDEVAITIRPLKSGGTGGLLRSVELADGTVLLDD
jgi:hypothetical protein